MREVAIIGGGPAGMCLGVALARRGVDAVVLERGDLPGDKACGEGLMPKGLRVLDALGVRAHLDPDGCAPFRSIRYVQEDGTHAQAAVPGGGLGVRRTALMAALLARATELGLEVRSHSGVRAHHQESDRVRLELDQGVIDARWVVACDGLASPTRRAAGLELPSRGPARYGLRQHFRRAAWTDAVEIHFAQGAEAYVTPAGPERIGVAFLFTRAAEEPLDFARLLGRFPALERKISGAVPDSEPRGAGPFLRRVRRPVEGRVVLLGDAAGYVDAITGDGLSLAFRSAQSLAAVLPDMLKAGDGGNAGGSGDALARWVKEQERAFGHYARWTHALLAIAHRPALRRRAISGMANFPRLFEWLVARAVG